MWDMRRAASTTAGMSSRLKKFSDFLVVNALLQSDPTTGMSVVPDTTPTLLAFFAVWCVNKASPRITTYASLYNYTAAIRAHCRDNGKGDPTRGTDGGPDPVYSGVMTGIKRKLAVTAGPPKRTPVSKRALDLICDAALDTDYFDDHLGLNIAAAACFCWYLLLRIGEATTHDGKVHKPSHGERMDIEFFPSIDASKVTHAVFKLKVHKTSQFRTGYCLTLFSTGAKHDPVKLMVRLFKKQPRSGPIFDFRSAAERQKGNEPHASRKEFVSLVTKCLELQGEDTRTIKGHSFRQGGCSALLNLGIPEWLTSILGRWKSDCYKKYAFAGMDTIQDAMQKMARSTTTFGVNQGQLTAI